MNEEPCNAAAESKDNNKVGLRRSLGMWNGVSVVLGCIIGSGIFVSPRGVLLDAGSVGASLCVWAASGLFATLGALCFAELGTSIATSGADYTYIGMSYGPLPAFLFLWIYVLVIMPCSNAIAALTFASYLLTPVYGSECEPPQNAIRVCALALMLILTYVNIVSVSSTMHVQNVFSSAKVVALLSIIGLGAYAMMRDHDIVPLHDNIAPHHDINNITTTTRTVALDEPLWQGTRMDPTIIAKAFYAAFYTFSGWNALNCVTEEMRNPTRTMPRAIVISLAAVTSIYLLANLAYFALLTKSELVASDAIAVQVAEHALPSWLRWTMPAAVAMSAVGGLNGAIFTCSRVLFAGAREGHLMRALGSLSQSHMTPVVALVFMCAVSCVYLISTSILSLIEYTIFVDALFAACSVSSVLVLRRTQPQRARPIRVPAWVPCLYLLFSFLLIVLPLYNSPTESLCGLALLAAGVPVYFVTVRWRHKPAPYERALNKLNDLAQLLTNSVMPTAACTTDDDDEQLSKLQTAS